MSEKTEAINAVLQKHNLTVESVFVPFSQSRNAGNGEKFPSLNWKVTLKHSGKNVLTTDYSAGCGHAPSYKKIKNHLRPTWQEMELVKYECEKGKKAGYWGDSLSSVMPPTNPKNRGEILPNSLDVVHSLLLDSEVLQAGSFEEWAREFGYDEDSRQAEKTYNACMKIALKFNQLGESVISELREVFQDY